MIKSDCLRRTWTKIQNLDEKLDKERNSENKWKGLVKKSTQRYIGKKRLKKQQTSLTIQLEEINQQIMAREGRVKATGTRSSNTNNTGPSKIT